MQHTVHMRGFHPVGSSSVRFNGVPADNSSLAVFFGGNGLGGDN